jgi:peptidyl-prolyl cis-trans isomerase B (cyclophilin B)
MNAAPGAATSTPSASAAASGAPAGCRFVPDGEPPARPAPVPASEQPVRTGTVAVAVASSAGPVPLTLDRARGACAVTSFVSLARAGYFDGTPCHRLTTAGIFVLQCGDPTGQGTGGPGYTINDEPPTDLPPGPSSRTVTYPRGTLAMAKTSAPDSGGSQFFLVYADSPLPPDYTVFGTVDAAGLATLDKVAAAGSDDSNGQGDGKPKTSVTLTSVQVS